MGQHVSLVDIELLNKMLDLGQIGLIRIRYDDLNVFGKLMDDTLKNLPE